MKLLRLVEHSPSLVKNSVVGFGPGEGTGFAGMLILNCGEGVAPPDGDVFGVARRSAATAVRMSLEELCSIAV